MGQILSEPVTTKESDQGSDENLMYGLSSMQGYRRTMEDKHAAFLKLGDTGASFFGVYDGHGGVEAAEYTSEHLHVKIHESEHFAKKEYESALKDGFLALDREYRKNASDTSGCAAVTALITPDRKSLFVANAGDSRAIISTGGKKKELSYDHKPTNKAELQRIVNAGGFVEYGRVNANLAMSRAIGDFEFKENSNLPDEDQIVTCDPEIQKHNLTEDDEFFVLACDGIWDCMENQEVVDYVVSKVVQSIPLSIICEDTMDYCLKEVDNDNAGSVGTDNMSMIIVAILNGKTKDQWYTWMKEKHAPKMSANISPSIHQSK